MVRCLIHGHNQQYKMTCKGDDAEDMCGNTLEPDPRYDSCCSNIFRPGKVLRDIVKGLLVVLAIAVVIAVVFVIIFYVVPGKEGVEPVEHLNKSAIVGRPAEHEVTGNGISEVEFTDNTRYDVAPNLERIREEEDVDVHAGHDHVHDHNHEHADHDHAHHDHTHHNHAHKQSSTEPTPEQEAEPEPASEPEPEPEATPEPEPEAEPEAEPEPAHMGKEEVTHDAHEAHHQGHSEGESGHEHGHLHEGHDMAHDHTHHHDDMTHVHTHAEGDMTHDHSHDGDMTHDHSHDGDMTHDHSHDGDMTHDHSHDGDMTHDHSHDGDMTHDHSHDGDMTHDHSHDGDMTHDHSHDGDMTHDHSHDGDMTHDHSHDGDMTHDHSHDGDMTHDHSHDGDMTHDHSHDGDMTHDHTHAEGDMSHDHNSEFGHEHVHAEMGHDQTATTAHENPEATPSAAVTTEKTIVSVSSTGGVVVKSSESEVTHLPPTSIPPLLDVLGTHAAPAEDTNGNCRPRSLEMCRDLPYALTSLPNWANDKSDYELHNASLPFFRDVIVRSRCSPRAREYSCAILEPQCGANGAIIPPCRTFCRSVASTCQEFVIKGFGLSDVFKCDRFPDSTDPAVCFDATQGLSSSTTPASETPEPQTSFPGEEVATTIPEYATEDAVTEGAVEETTFFTTAPETCPELMCLDGTCLAISQLNDGVNDCADGTDEQNFSELISIT
ncbi:clumping factor B-like isoform X2 [Penaeus indicus]|uniref:clumping factor B-like isoform X2 n=1 Tax=Penaeus indicus TaxID=29960 RepID=UPI00300CC0D9